MRVYVPATLPRLRSAISSGQFRPVSGVGFAVTSALRAEYDGADVEDLEYLAMHDAALASLRLIAAERSEPVRVVLAVDNETAREQQRSDLDRAVVHLPGNIAWTDVVSVHLDGGDVAGVVAAAAEAVTAADLGDDDAAITVGNAEDVDLAWYAPGEMAYLLAELDGR